VCDEARKGVSKGHAVWEGERMPRSVAKYGMEMAIKRKSFVFKWLSRFRQLWQSVAKRGWKIPTSAPRYPKTRHRFCLLFKPQEREDSADKPFKGGGIEITASTPYL
jgi:hypothetical protein